MIAGDLGNEFDFSVSETHQFGVSNQIVRMQMVFGVRHDDAHIGQKCGEFEIAPPVAFEAQGLLQFVEQLSGQLRYMSRVFGSVIATIGQLLHAVSRRVVLFVAFE